MNNQANFLKNSYPFLEADTLNRNDGLMISLVIPLKNEAGNILPLVDEITNVLKDECAYEIILIDDASDDHTHEEICLAKNQYPEVKHLSHEKCLGKSAAQHTGIIVAASDIIVTLDGDGQNNPAYIPKMLKMLLDNADSNVGMVTGIRLNRKDTASKKWGSKIANKIRKFVLNDDTIDTGCGLKIFFKHVYLCCPFFDHSHRYMPALFKREGFKVMCLDVVDRPRGHGQSKVTNLGRLLVGIPDILGVMWLMRRRKLTKIIEFDKR